MPPLDLLRPGRLITGMSAILLPFDNAGGIAWGDFETHVGRTRDAGLRPAVNMDTGYANLISDAVRNEVLDRTAAICGGEFVAGVYVDDHPGETLNLDAYRIGLEAITSRNGLPIFFQSHGLTSLDDDGIYAAYETLAQDCDQFLFFELGTMFAPFGKIYSLELYERLMQLSGAIGAKHSSLRREPEWDRLRIRDRVRPEFMVLTGNDLAIDMVMYGSDYLLGISTFDPVAFSLRDAYWESGDPRFFELNDLLQYLGSFAFRPPVPAYKHSAAMFLKHRGRMSTDRTHPQSPTRPARDGEVLASIAADLDRLLRAATS